MILRSVEYKELTLFKQKSLINKLVESIYSIQSDMNFEFRYTIYNHDLVVFLYPRDKQVIQTSAWLKELFHEISKKALYPPQYDELSYGADQRAFTA